MIADPLPLINTFLSKVGLGRQVFDANNGMALSFDDITIGLHKDNERQLLLVSSVIASIPHDADAAASAAAFAVILEASLAGIMTGAGAVGLNRGSGLLVYGNAIGLAGLDQAAFETFFERSVNAIEDWHALARRSQLAESRARPGAPAGADDAAAVIPV